MVDPDDVMEHRVVIDPDGANDNETDRLGDVGRPQVPEFANQSGAGMRKPYIQNERRDRNRNHAIAKCLRSIRLHDASFALWDRKLEDDEVLLSGSIVRSRHLDRNRTAYRIGSSVYDCMAV